VRTHDRLWPPVLAVAAGGVAGALCRYGLSEAFPSMWTTWAINVAGCLLIGALMPLVAGRVLLQPFLGPGVLGGFTTFSAYTVDVRGLLADDRFATAALYLLATLLAALLAVWAGAVATERLLR
jgi:fluoride exporter